ncbi:hypothetical protein [Alloalcanivorax xenomutans]|uniref:hypothetical protein n=1 Tax=Alloalcanivorax xenomutans TaxID=1094342 RepID=UPI001F3BA281|nr:hypothetical protein [Alloalcanivorax xenomutans]MCE7524203.1 hypothetical protein [Alloalcanivorax xenomutans]
MKSKAWIIGLLAMVVSMPAFAQLPDDAERKVIDSLMTRIAALEQTGRELHEKYPDSKTAEAQKACKADFPDLPEQARNLRGEAAALQTLAFKVHLSMAANDLVQCVDCLGTVTSCDGASASLERARDQMKRMEDYAKRQAAGEDPS